MSSADSIYPRGFCGLILIREVAGETYQLSGIYINLSNGKVVKISIFEGEFPLFCLSVPNLGNISSAMDCAVITVVYIHSW